MTDQELERRLRSWYQAEVPADLAVPADLRSRVEAIPRPSTQPWRGSARRRGFTLLAAAALTGTIVGTALVGGLLTRPDRSVVPPTQTTSTDASPFLRSVAPSLAPGSSGLIAYVKWVPLEAVGGVCAKGEGKPATPTGCSRIWISNTDGTGAHELLPEQPGYQTPIQWSADGTSLLVEDAVGLWLVDTAGTIVRSLPSEGLCPGDCPPIWDYALSPDGSTIAFARPPVTTTGNSVIALADVATGHVTELASTASPVSTASYGADAPRWSPDGTRLIFTREKGGSQPGGGLFMVDVDGTDLHQFVPMELYAILPRWSPDGSLIAFESLAAGKQEIVVVRPDGTDLRHVTGDGYAWPAWTADGRLVATQFLGNGYERWIMDASGANAAVLPIHDVIQLTAAKCLVCVWDREGEIPNGDNAFWQPKR